MTNPLTHRNNCHCSACMAEFEAAQVPGVVQVDAYEVVSEMLDYFDSYKLATLAPLVEIIRRERREAVSLASQSNGASGTEGQGK